MGGFIVGTFLDQTFSAPGAALVAAAVAAILIGLGAYLSAQETAKRKGLARQAFNRAIANTPVDPEAERDIDEVLALMGNSPKAGDARSAQLVEEIMKSQESKPLALAEKQRKLLTALSSKGLPAASIVSALHESANRPETEEDGLRSGELRRLQALHRSKQFMAQSKAPSEPPITPPVDTNMPLGPTHDSPEFHELTDKALRERLKAGARARGKPTP
ncbi:MAG TPA: hypothetical protein VM240_05515 [Verrucomicrobiae bacterium]|nr:hypothetical protein [Verrucomicrobiae bacterium]